MVILVEEMQCDTLGSYGCSLNYKKGDWTLNRAADSWCL